MLTKGSVEWWHDLLERYELVRGRMSQKVFCAREGANHNVFVYRMFGDWPHRRKRAQAQRRKAQRRKAPPRQAKPLTMLPVKVVEPGGVAKVGWVEAEVPAGVMLRFQPGTPCCWSCPAHLSPHCDASAIRVTWYPRSS